MERQHNRSPRDRKTESPRRDAASSNTRDARTNRNPAMQDSRNDIQTINGLNKYRLNDLYERSSI